MNQTPNQKNIVHGSITAGGNVHIGDYLVTYHNYFAAQEVKIPHRLNNNIPTNAEHILGRDAELATTKDYLAQNQATVLFNGIGGIGKTSVASKYMALNGSEYQHLAWITVQSTLAEAFINNAPLLASLQITQQVQDYIAAKQLDKAFEYLFHQLNLLERTLVVIDNANDLDDLEQYKNWFDTANCHFLITSRCQPSEWATVDVDSLPEDEAVALFRKLHPSVSADDEAIKKLLSKLFYHTLLIELVAKAGKSTGIAFADLQSMIETQFIHHQSLNEAPIPTGKHGSVVATNLKKAKIEDYIWLIFSKVKGLDDNSKLLLKAMALLPVATPFDLDFLKEHFAFFNIPDAVVHLDALIERGWLQKEQAEGQKPYFKMHPLIGDVVVENLEVDIAFAERYILQIADLIYYEYTNTQHNLFGKNRNRIYAERLSDLFFEKNTMGVSELLDNLGLLEDNFGFYQKAVEYEERALQIALTLYDKNHKIIAVRQSNLAMAYGGLGKFEKSIALLKAALESDLKNFDELHPVIAFRQAKLATAYQSLGNYNKAILLLETALAINIKNFGETHPRVAMCQSSLAICYQNVGYYDISIKLSEKALESDLKILGDSHPSVAIHLSNLALMHRSLGNHTKAINLSEKALECALKNFGNNNPKISTFQSNLGGHYHMIGDYEKAINLFEISLASDIKNFGYEHHSVAVTQNNLAWAYSKLGYNIKAKALWKAAYKNYLKNFGDSHPHTLMFKEYSEF